MDRQQTDLESIVEKKSYIPDLEARRRLLRELSLVMLMTITGVPKVWLMYSSKLSSAMLIGSSSLMSIAIWTALFICSSENLVCKRQYTPFPW
jgi:hypothetical protein